MEGRWRIASADTYYSAESYEEILLSRQYIIIFLNKIILYQQVSVICRRVINILLALFSFCRNVNYYWPIIMLWQWPSSFHCYSQDFCKLFHCLTQLSCALFIYISFTVLQCCSRRVLNTLLWKYLKLLQKNKTEQCMRR